MATATMGVGRGLRAGVADGGHSQRRSFYETGGGADRYRPGEQISLEVGALKLALEGGHALLARGGETR